MRNIVKVPPSGDLDVMMKVCDVSVHVMKLFTSFLAGDFSSQPK